MSMLCVGFAFLTSLRNGCLHNSYGDFAPTQCDVVMFVLRVFITLVFLALCHRLSKLQCQAQEKT